MGTIKAIGFDFGGVIGGNPNIGHEFTAMSADLLGITTQQWRKVYFSLNHLLNTRAKSRRDFWRRFLEEFDQVNKLEKVLAQDAAMSQRYRVINHQILALIDKLRSGGHKVGLLSNATGEVAEWIKQLDIAHHFDAFLFSAEIGLQKPDIAAFNYLAKQLETNLVDLIFIDDSDTSLRTAKNVGYTPILFKSYNQLVSDLTTLKVL